jgi:aminopeptidase YwaD
LATNPESRLEKVRAKRARGRRLVLLVTCVLLAGLLAGAGTNLIFAKPKAARTVTKTSTSKSGTKQTSPATDTSQQRGQADKGPATPQFSSQEAMSHAYALSVQIGARPAGSVRESGAADYIVNKLGEYGYTVEEQTFTTPDGFSSRNIVGTLKGNREDYVIVVGAHYDSPVESRGADDNASGAGAVLELARVFSVRQIEPTLQFVFFGGNRPGATEENARMLGSRHYVELLGSFEKGDIVSMIELDSVGQGSTLTLKTEGTGLQRLKDKLETFARKKNQQTAYVKTGGDSDNIPFEDAGVTAVWVGWCEADGSIQTDNVYTSLDAGKVATAGVLVESFISSLSSQDLEELKY